LKLWHFQNISDYWDNQDKNSILEYARLISTLPLPEQRQIENQIREAIFDHVAALNDKQLVYAAFIIADDIYKSANEISLFIPYISEYLRASAGTFYDLLKQRGYYLHYLTNTVFAGSAFQGFIRPLHIFWRFFEPAGIRYVCPHAIALELMQRDGISEEDFEQNLAAYLPRAEAAGNAIIHRCHADKRHYINLQIDGGDRNFRNSFAHSQDQGTITVLRSEVPVRGTSCSVIFPGQQFNIPVSFGRDGLN
jgi:hypothetical protein